MNREHRCTVGRFGQVRVRAVCSCGGVLVVRVSDRDPNRFGVFTLIGTLCPALDLARRRLKAAGTR